ncbi:hypothetical protein ARALYDRAFT_895423 [Arabidopsis lyrata subsp. lyrata]|uniref:Uncharacterized protein n=1 Tax=Arabidopsis lyrata subsp. lyrata TaxID=81972 RepID=D7KSQ2_ARALL|nr:hypothetical protein ARALYDRAFT_895423 [Arabidopsis lyrata subsp. lyrata]
MAPSGGKRKRGRGGGGRAPKVSPNRPVANRPTASGTSNRRPSTLPSQYTFTPANPEALETQQSPVNPIALESQPPTHRDYPPPTQLFQSGDDSPRGSGSHQFRESGSTQVRGSGSVQGRGSVGSIHRLASRSNQPPAPVQPPASTQPAASNRQIPSRQQRPSPQPRASVSHHSSQAQNSHEESEDEEAEGESEEDVLRDSTLPEDVLADLRATLLIPGREKYTTVISPNLEPKTTW